MTNRNASEPVLQLWGLGQSLWLDSMSRELLQSGKLERYRDEFLVTGLTSNPTLFDKAIKESQAYDEAIHLGGREGRSAEEVFFGLALEDLAGAARIFRRAFDTSGGRDGWVSLELSPLLADDAHASVAAAVKLHERAGCPNLFIKIPGTPAGNEAIEEAIYRGVPINVTLLFSAEQYRASAEAYRRGIERRLKEGLDPKVPSVASLFVSRWDVAVEKRVPPSWRNRLGIAVARRTYRSHIELHTTGRWMKLAEAGALKQKLLFASTGTKDPEASDTLYIEALAAPDTINTVPEKTLQAYAAHGRFRGPLPEDGGDAEEVLARYREQGVDLPALAAKLQREGAAAFVKSWRDLLRSIAAKDPQLRTGT